ncbi:MAG TPA: glycosyltransferase, partial [Oceanospirillales bacterium]|nr:glycosyltransferase [Oceanospirillales bacterium]
MDISDYIKKIHAKSLLSSISSCDNEPKQNRAIDIIVPVFNGFEELQLCVAALLKFTHKKHQITFYNDASTDERIKPFLDKLTDKHVSLHVVHQIENRGYLHNINFAMQQSKNDVVLLNADTQVTENWLEELAIIAADKNIGIVCPLSDNATILSLNKSCLENIAELHDFSGQWYALPTAVGSCMYIKRFIIEKFGVFDDYYHPGYGEECDYSLKIRQADFQIACAPAAFVFHHGSASFQDDANVLKQQHQDLLDLRWYGYSAEVENFSENNPIHFIEDYLTNCKQENNVLHVVHGLESLAGVELFTKKLLNDLPNTYNNHVLIYSVNPIPGLSRQSFRLNENTKISKYQFFSYSHHTKIANLIVNIKHNELDIMFMRYLLFGQYKMVHFHSLVNNGSLIWPLICEYLAIPYVVSCHDHFVACSNFSLLK